MLRLIDDSRKPFSVQLASFLSVCLKFTIVNFAKGLHLTNRNGPRQPGESDENLQELYEHIGDFDDVIEALDEAGDIVKM